MKKMALGGYRWFPVVLGGYKMALDGYAQFDKQKTRMMDSVLFLRTH